MECNFGYDIRKGQEQQAIIAYKELLTPVQTEMATAKALITKQDTIITGLFELVEKLVETPSGDPKALTGAKKEKFDISKRKNEKMEGSATALQQMKKDKNK